ncbi:MAG TPA: hypothetical protein DHV53_02930 [Gammaproteobacteria bacterium]|nr:hypothetical protein [Gammaproteobacteria bacterium]HAU24420.1 hypothetical protein [Gammaproteobacteria bacterium]HCI87580.1 hypothetical protein [Gammaproteobacteria bacterium]|tara:strand:- start:1350 stop:1973 length:624 start_codon:yes stop_codon:yes gene_type:complete
MIDNSFRELLPRYVDPLVRLLNRIGLTPNQVTCLGLAIALGAAWLVVQENFLAALVVWWLSRLLDALDGIYARQFNKASDFGAFLDIQFDMLAYSAMVLAFSSVWPEYNTQWLLMLFCYVLCISGALGLGGFENKRGLEDSSGRGLRLATGLAEGGETGIAYSMFLLFPAWLAVTTWIWLAVLAVTILARLLLARTELSPRELEPDE